MVDVWQYSAISEWIYRRQADAQGLTPEEIFGSNFSIPYTLDIELPIELKALGFQTDGGYLHNLNTGLSAACLRSALMGPDRVI